MNMIIVCLFVLLSLFIVSGLFIHNPKLSQRQNKTSTVTCSNLGKRGDTGNQIFQLACVIASGKRSNANIILPSRTVSLPIVDLFDLTQFEWKDIKHDKSFNEYDNYEFIEIPDNGLVYNIKGYRQAYLYFEEYSEEIRKIFTPKKELLESVKKVLPEKYIAVHIRRGDYIKWMHSIPLLKEFKQCQIDYYRKGVLELKKSHPDCQVIVCTDSPDLILPILQDIDDKAIISPAVYGMQGKFSDFCIIYLADAVVMSNSTFSWWASYLKNDRPIISPSPWWDPKGFVGTAMALDGPYLYHPDWTILDSDSGELLRKPYQNFKNKYDNNHETLSLYKLIRGILL